MLFNLYSKYYDLVYQDKDYLGETKYITNVLNEITEFKIHSVLELGGGSGNHAFYLSEYFDEIFGVELSSSMVELATNRNILNYHVKQGDICLNHYPNQKFDCAISLFHVISYLNTNNQILDCFKSVNDQLKTGGLFLFDVWYTPAVYSLKPETRVKNVQNNELKITRIAQSVINEDSSTVDVNYKIFVEDLKLKIINNLEETHKMRHFTTNEIKLMAENTGFEFIKSEEFLTSNPPSSNSWGVLYCLKKK